MRHPRRIPRDPRNVRIEALIHANGSVIPEVPDVVFQSEQVHGLNSGFFFARPTAASVAFADLWLERIASQHNSSANYVDEQHALNSAVMRLKTEGKVNFTYGVLDDEQFPNGKIWWQYPSV